MADSDLLDEGTLARQRRNLVVTCIVLLVFYLAGGAFEANQPMEISTTVGKFVLKEPSVILAFVWFAFFYFTWRYWLYARPVHAEVSSRYHERREGDDRLAKEVRRQFDTYELGPINAALMMPTVDPTRIVCLPKQIKYKSVGLWTEEITTPFQLRLEDGTYQVISEGLELTKHVPLKNLAWHFSRNFFRAAVGRTAFSDLIGPYVVAALTLAICGERALSDVLAYFGY